MMIFTLLVVLFIWINSILNAIMDKRKSARHYPEWHKEFSNRFHLNVFDLVTLQVTIPHFLWSKFRNWWHVVKQVYFIGSNFLLTLLAIASFPFWFQILAFVIIIGVAQVLWDVIPSPEWWD